ERLQPRDGAQHGLVAPVLAEALREPERVVLRLLGHHTSSLLIPILAPDAREPATEGATAATRRVGRVADLPGLRSGLVIARDHVRVVRGIPLLDSVVGVAILLEVL